MNTNSKETPICLEKVSRGQPTFVPLIICIIRHRHSGIRVSLQSLVTDWSGIALSSFVYIAEVVESVVWGVLDQDSGMDVVHVSIFKNSKGKHLSYQK